MVELSRTVRFCLNGPVDDADTPVHNGFAAWPAMRGLGRYYELHVWCAGEPDPVTGYLINIRDIDQAVRQGVLPLFRERIENDPAGTPMGRLMRDIIGQLGDRLPPRVTRVRLDLTPTHSLEIESQRMSDVTIRQRYEFSAAHRLHVDSLSPEENRAVFGKCNNPSGHGHNYQFEVAVRAPVDRDGHLPFVEALDRLVDRVVIEKLDHKHLNVDVPEFAEVNPSVERIAELIYSLLSDTVTALDVSLHEVRVWETGKTACTYAGPAKTLS